MLRHSLVLATLCVVACTLPIDRAVGPGEIRAVAVRALPSGGFEPVAGALATLEGSRLHATSDASGRLVLRGVPAGTWVLRLEATATDGTELAARRPGILLDARGDGSASGRDLGNVVLDAVGAIEGVVLLDGAPVAGAVVGAQHVEATMTDAEGRFVLRRLARGAYELGVAVSRGADRVLHATYAAAVQPRETTQVTLDLGQLPAHDGGRVSGLALQLDNPDWANIEVWLEQPGVRAPLPLGKTDADGRYASIAAIRPGIYTLRARAPDGALASRAAVFVRGDTALDPLYIPRAESVDDDDEDGVLDDDDNCVSWPNPAQQDTDGDAQGDACDEDLDGDEIPNPLDFSIEPVTATEVEGTVGETLPAFVVRVRNAWGEPAAGRTVTFSPSRGSVSVAQALTSADGLASVEFTPSVVPGVERMVASTSPLQSTTFAVTVQPGAPAQLVLAGFSAPIKRGHSGPVTVEARDAYGNRSPRATGALAFASTDAALSWPANAAFTVEDQGRTTVAITFPTPGTHTLEAQLVEAITVRGSLSGIVITPPVCGDGETDPDGGEDCDDANGANTDLCTNACRNAACGDGYEQPGEVCDDGNDDDLDACRNDCTLPVCGDGKLSYGEECDDGNANDGDDCNTSCRLTTCNGEVVWPATDPSPVFVVTSLDDNGAGTFRDAITQAPAGSTIRIAVEGTITLTGELHLTKNVTIRGPGRGKLTLDGVDTFRIFRIDDGLTVTVSGLTLSRGRSICNGGCPADLGFGGCVYNGANTTFADVEMRNCMAGDGTNSGRGGGAIFNRPTGNVILASSTITASTANYRTAGGAFLGSGTLSLCRSAVTHNGNINGPGASGIHANGIVRISDSYFGNNSAPADSPALWLSNGANSFVRSSTFVGNTGGDAGSGGGSALRVLGTNPLLIENSTFVGNSVGRAQGRRGAVQGPVQLRNTIVAGNWSSVAANDNVAGAVTSLGHNVIGSVGETTSWLPNDIVGTDVAPLDVRRGTTVTVGRIPVVPLLAESPALDAADPTGLPSTDVRGRPRVQGPLPDIGAFESAMPTFAAVVPNPEPGRLTVLVDVDPHGRGAIVNAELADNVNFTGARSSTARAGAGTGTRQLAVAFENVPAGTWNLRVTASNVDGQRRTTPVQVVIP